MMKLGAKNTSKVTPPHSVEKPENIDTKLLPKKIF
jgi:hypothetical protein